MSASDLILRVAVPTPLRRSFDYLPPSACNVASLQPGVRLRLPFGRRHVVGVLLEVTARSEVPLSRLKRAAAVLDAAPVIPTELMTLLTWASRYYQHPIGEVLQHALPALLRQGAQARIKRAEFWRLTPVGAALNAAELARAPRQAVLLAQLQNAKQGLSATDLNIAHVNWRPVMARLVEKGWVEKYEHSALSATLIAEHPPLELNPDQQQAVAEVCASLESYRCFLLHGITGSGKTEVYLRIIHKVLAAGRQALVLVPEIGLTPQLVQRFRERIEAPVVVLHSGLSDQERLNAWLSASSGEARVIIGTRSALFTPLAKPGLFIVDEEHDLSFKQQDGFRYHARDLAIVRAQKAGVPILLGSATPSLESLYNVEQQRSRQLDLPERAGSAVHPHLRLLDVRSQRLEHGLSAQLLSAIRQHLEQNNQVLLFLNRRGFAPLLMCHDCGWHARCLRCDAHMTVHQGARRLRCHHCGSERPLDPRCPACNGDKLLFMGAGTERVEEALGEHFPDYPILRIDRDSTRRKGAMQALLDDIHQGRAKLLVGTQMLAKGHHFPNVTLAGLLDADYGLFSTDFRASERMGQLILQVAGRAGRAEQPGEVLIQTRQPDNPLLSYLLRQDYSGLSRALLQERAESRLPPYSHLALLRAESVDAQAAMSFLHQAHNLAENPRLPELELFGPLPAPMERRAGRYRAQLLFQHANRSQLQQWLTAMMPRLEALKGGRKVRWSLDVDPMEMY